MKETQIQHLLRLFQENNNKLTLGMILKTSLGAAYRPRLSDLREMGYTVDCDEDKKEPSNNLYTLSKKSTEATEDTLTKKPLPVDCYADPTGEHIVFAGKQCSCGSWYKRGDKCNICGKVVGV
ncbi:MAG: hypothetical protein GY861_12820 [bacterium]|nr:hypothetical protein [bacterium]